MRGPTWLRMSHKQYIVDFLKRTNMLTTKLAQTPMVVAPSLSLSSGSPLNDGFEYRSMLGALEYLLLTRLDIAFVVNKAYHFLHAPTDEH